MDLAAVLTQSLLVAGVSDAELVVQIILSNGININTLLEEIILSDEGLQKLGIDPATVHGDVTELNLKNELCHVDLFQFSPSCIFAFIWSEEDGSDYC